MTTPPANAKSILREEIRARLKTIPAAERASASAGICARLAREKFFTDAQTILFFAPLPGEPDVWPLLAGVLRAGQRVALPRFSAESGDYLAAEIRDVQRDLVIGGFGIREPAPDCPGFPLNRLDLALVPGLGFDLCGGRLGRGNGFYDRMLGAIRGVKCGLGFDVQVLAAIPSEPHDVKMDCVLTPMRRLEFASRGAAGNK